MEMELVLAGTETALGLGRRWSWAGTEMELGLGRISENRDGLEEQRWR